MSEADLDILESTEETIELRPEREDLGARLDSFVAGMLPDISRTFVQQLIDQDLVLVDGVVRRAKFKMTPGQTVSLTIPAPVVEEIRPEPIPLDIVYEDADVLVIDKPAGLVVHPAAGHPSGTLVNAVVYHAPEIAVNGSTRPGIIHRLDKDTSGLIAVVKTDRGRATLVPQWENRTVTKTYVTLASGVVETDEGTIEAPIARDPKNRQRMAVVRTGREARTHFRVLERFKNATLLEISLETGRTHQIRVHLAFIGSPVVGDALYGGNRPRSSVESPRQFLHAAGLGFTLPSGERVHFESGLPPDLQHVLDTLRVLQ